MDNTVQINRDVNIIAYYFRGKDKPNCFPKRMDIDGRQITFTETGLQHPTQKGQRMVHIFDMTDGKADYRLEFDAEVLSWKLVAISDANHATTY
ncbi:MAG: hypothetical protein WCG30_03920 [Candidatus Saccharibacteria bacterium]|jgi:hypothetical protein